MLMVISVLHNLVASVLLCSIDLTICSLPIPLTTSYENQCQGEVSTLAGDPGENGVPGMDLAVASVFSRRIDQTCSKARWRWPSCTVFMANESRSIRLAGSM